MFLALALASTGLSGCGDNKALSPSPPSAKAAETASTPTPTTKVKGKPKRSAYDDMSPREKRAAQAKGQ